MLVKDAIRVAWPFPQRSFATDEERFLRSNREGINVTALKGNDIAPDPDGQFGRLIGFFGRVDLHTTEVAGQTGHEQPVPTRTAIDTSRSPA
ncbi:hypothetical protein LMG27177_06863 [Paraburkholderia fynbosensis]|uniref:Uncharacterized protein n=1 Tax=Paraburkholderia fynbosensis TaxID=1200993 RepID=A0A6J5H1Q3_9BURK|nr:hypothetical protein LMG27177_06863 [Paraburkholderia fynbosensis]